ncbi:MAG: molecular chaperone TorD family protein [Candidatus Krumholzibacteria bacterium]|jgi:nitrate reductase molybdenum cofactor assembly chaperone|nr:molecular chaperone TorD family protein [Candidatus Krumholzibacteria bacterium]MDP6796595.1 molecular chaperone TorD family protein [Candidatus Krumholzibacteria bacterium]MDP7021123.1 molecular chaperone TorD family protein [Candidatus Krumholzibacteria bacterium]
MIRTAQHPFELLAQLLDYPHAGYQETVKSACEELDNQVPELGSGLRGFAEFVEATDLCELEEQFTRTFDINPVCNLELGWLLYGEQYERGAFLVRMREMLRSYEVEETAELPDHLCHVLPLLSRLPEEQAKQLAVNEVLPAMSKMRKGFAEIKNPYRQVIEVIGDTLLDAYGMPSASDESDLDPSSKEDSE